MKRALVVVAVLAASVACGTTHQKPQESRTAVCKADMVSQYQDRLNGGHPGTGPASCQSLSVSVRAQLAKEVTSGD